MADYKNLIIPRSYNDYLQRGESQKIIDEQSQVTLTVGETVTLSSDSAARVENSGTVRNAVLNFSIPKGAKGDNGALVETSGMYAMRINNNGELEVCYSGTAAPALSLNDNGELIFEY